MKEEKGFSFNFKKEEIRVLNPDEMKELKQLMKTTRMHQISPDMEYVLPGRTLIKFLDQIADLKNRLEKYEKVSGR